MPNGDKPTPVRPPAWALKRPRYEPGNYLAARDLFDEQTYRRQRLRHHNRYLHGWGVVCGLWVVPAGDPAKPWLVQVCPGYALDPCGGDLEVRQPVSVDLQEHLWKRPQAHLTQILPAYVALRSAAEPARFSPTHPPRCGCDDPAYQPTRVREGFRVDILWSLPPSPGEDIDFCREENPPCPAPPPNLYVVLARVALPPSEREPITASHINNLKLF